MEIRPLADAAAKALRGCKALDLLPDETLVRGMLMHRGRMDESMLLACRVHADDLPPQVRLSRLGRLQRRDRYHGFYHEGARPDGLFVLLSGAVRLQAGGDESGRDLKPPCVFGLESLAALGETALGIRPVERLESATSTLPSVVVHVRGALILSAILEQAS